MILTSKVYNFVKFIAQILLPAIGSLYFALAGIWGLPAANQVVGTIVVIDTFLGGILSVSSNAYNNSDVKHDGTMNIIPQPDGTKLVSLELNHDAGVIADAESVSFKVKTAPDVPPPAPVV